MFHVFYTFGKRNKNKIETMQNFQIPLKKTDNYVYESNYKSVIKKGKSIGTCKMVLEDNKVIGIFELDVDMEINNTTPQYIKYNSTVLRNKKWILNVEFLDKQTSDTVQSIP